MKDKIDLINRVLRKSIALEKTVAIQKWVSKILRLFNHYKTEHSALLKEATALLELALWKARLDDEKRRRIHLPEELQPRLISSVEE